MKTGKTQKRNNHQPIQNKSKSIIKSSDFKLPWAKREQDKLRKIDSAQIENQSSLISIQPAVVEDPIVDNKSSSEIHTQESSDISLKLDPPNHFLDLCGSPDIELEVIKKRSIVGHLKRVESVINAPKIAFKQSTTSDANDDASLFNYLDTPFKKPHSQQVSPARSTDDSDNSGDLLSLQKRVSTLESFMKSHFKDFPN